MPRHFDCRVSVFFLQGFSENLHIFTILHIEVSQKAATPLINDSGAVPGIFALSDTKAL